MKVNQILTMGLIKDDTLIFINDESFGIIDGGNWYQDNILKYMHNEIEDFSWKDNNRIFITIK